MKCHPSRERSCDAHIQLHHKTTQLLEKGRFFFCAESTLLKPLDLLATSWDEKPSWESDIYTTPPFLLPQRTCTPHPPPPHMRTLFPPPLSLKKSSAASERRSKLFSLWHTQTCGARLADEIMQGVKRGGWEGAVGGLTKRSQSLLLINHCSVFDLSFAKGAKRGGGGGGLTPPQKRRENSEGKGIQTKMGISILNTEWKWIWLLGEAGSPGSSRWDQTDRPPRSHSHVLLKAIQSCLLGSLPSQRACLWERGAGSGGGVWHRRIFSVRMLSSQLAGGTGRRECGAVTTLHLLEQSAWRGRAGSAF